MPAPAPAVTRSSVRCRPTATRRFVSTAPVAPRSAAGASTRSTGAAAAKDGPKKRTSTGSAQSASAAAGGRSAITSPRAASRAAPAAPAGNPAPPPPPRPYDGREQPHRERRLRGEEAHVAAHAEPGTEKRAVGRRRAREQARGADRPSPQQLGVVHGERQEHEPGDAPHERDGEAHARPPPRERPRIAGRGARQAPDPHRLAG